MDTFKELVTCSYRRHRHKRKGKISQINYVLQITIPALLISYPFTVAPAFTIWRNKMHF